MSSRALMNTLGRFQLLEPLARGGMGLVWRARDLRSGSPAALKTTLPQPRARGLFQREVQAIASLDHPGLVQILDYGHVPHAIHLHGETLEPNAPWLAMEYAALGTLEAHAPAFGSWNRLAWLLHTVLDALAHAHARGIIHRDLKPANVLLARRNKHPHPVLTDFGLAHAAFAHNPKNHDPKLGPHLAPQAGSGTPGYMAPEQITGNARQIGPPTDLYALGCIAFELAARHPVFPTHTSSVALMSQHLSAPAPPLFPTFPTPEGFPEWVRRLLDKSPYQRFDNAADAAWALHQLGPPVAPTGHHTDTVEAHLDPPPLLVEAFESLETRVHHTAQTLVFLNPTLLSPAPAPAIDATELPRTRAPQLQRPWVPVEDWLEDARTQSAPTGLGLYSVRPPPMVGRLHVRQRLVEAFEDVFHHHTTRIFTLRGPTSVGKSWTAQWFAFRARELGMARVLRVRHGARPGGADGIARMLAYELSCRGLSRPRAREHIAGLLARWNPEAAPLQRQEDADVLATVAVSANPQIATEESATLTEAFLAVERLLRCFARTRPVVLWLDDVQWAAESLGAVHRLVQRCDVEAFPLFVIMTLRDDGLNPHSLEAQRIDALLQRSGSQAITLPPLSHDEHLGLVHRLLALDTTSAQRVAQHTLGQPMFAAQLLRDLVDRERLEPHPQGFALPPREPLAESMHTLWLARLMRHVDTDHEDALHALEIAACLGIAVDHAEWRMACDDAGVDEGVDPVGALVDAGLAFRVDEHVWGFVHEDLRHTLETRSRRAGRWPQISQICAEVLERSYGPEVLSSLVRRMVYLTDADCADEAADLTLRAAHLSIRQGDVDRAQTFAEHFDARVHSTPLDSYLRGDAIAMHIELLRVTDRLDEAVELTRTLETQAQHHGWPALIVFAMRARARVFLHLGRGQEAVELGRAALELARHTHDTRRTRAVPNALLDLAEIEWRLGLLDDALTHYEEAERHFIALEHDTYHAAMSQRGQGSVHLQRGNLARASVCFASAEERFRAIGARGPYLGCLVGRAEVARFRGDLELASALYQRVVFGFQTGATVQSVALLNLAVVAVQQEQWREAEQRFTQLLGQLNERALQAFCHLGLLVTRLDSPRWEDDLTHLRSQLAEVRLVDRDLRLLARLGAERAVAQGRLHQGLVLYRLAREQAVALDDPALTPESLDPIIAFLERSLTHE